MAIFHSYVCHYQRVAVALFFFGRREFFNSQRLAGPGGHLLDVADSLTQNVALHEAEIITAVAQNPGPQLFCIF